MFKRYCTRLLALACGAALFVTITACGDSAANPTNTPVTAPAAATAVTPPVGASDAVPAAVLTGGPMAAPVLTGGPQAAPVQTGQPALTPKP
ncbi:MAG TPA: hypothetical protein VM536_10035 [Chloroflexia bacterium]|nr:hypothetical protein [Chloroflexia bacterium]